jgi:carboxyl-terminal processing protease
MDKLKRVIWIGSLVLFLCLAGFFGGWISGESRASATDNTITDDSYESLRPLIQSLSLIRNNYVDEAKTKQKELVYGAIKGMVSTLDPYSQFMDPQSFKDMKQDTQGSFGGLGIEIAVKDNQLTIVTPIDGTPAQRAGVQPGDQIMRIDSKSTEGISIMDAVHKMRGVPGTKCVITLKRVGIEDWFDVSIIRAVIKIRSVRFNMLDGQIGYIRITEFMEQTGDDFEKALKTLEGQNMKGLILDLRNNPGGLLNMAAQIAEYFVPQGKLLVYTEGRNQGQNMKFISTARRSYDNGPLAVLVNQGSASASEIVAGAIQDWNLGVIVGEKTFGKGSVQTIIPLGDGSALRITTARYLTPKGQIIHGNGIKPDLLVEPFRPNEYTVRLVQDKRIEDFTKMYVKVHPKGEEPAEKPTENVKVSEDSWEKLKPKTQDEKLSEAFIQWMKEQRYDIVKADYAQDQTYILNKIREEIEIKLNGVEASHKIRLEGDPQVQRAKDAITIAARYGKK